MRTIYPWSDLLAAVVFFPTDATAFTHVWEDVSTITNAVTYCYKDGQDISDDVLTGSDTISSNIHTSKTLTIRDEDAGSNLILEFEATVEGNDRRRRIFIVVPQYGDGPFVGEHTMFPEEVKAFVFQWNSAAAISNASTRAYKDNQEITSSVLSGSDASTANVQNGKFLTPRVEDANSEIVYEFRATIEGRTFNQRILITIGAWDA